MKSYFYHVHDFRRMWLHVSLFTAKTSTLTILLKRTFLYSNVYTTAQHTWYTKKKRNVLTWI